jgi:hypothetical protein
MNPQLLRYSNFSNIFISHTILIFLKTSVMTVATISDASQDSLMDNPNKILAFGTNACCDSNIFGNFFEILFVHKSQNFNQYIRGPVRIFESVLPQNGISATCFVALQLS